MGLTVPTFCLYRYFHDHFPHFVHCSFIYLITIYWTSTLLGIGMKSWITQFLLSSSVPSRVWRWRYKLTIILVLRVWKGYSSSPVLLIPFRSSLEIVLLFALLLPPYAPNSCLPSPVSSDSFLFSEWVSCLVGKAMTQSQTAQEEYPDTNACWLSNFGKIIQLFRASLAVKWA